MKKLGLLMGAVLFSTVPLSVHSPQPGHVSLVLDHANAKVGHPASAGSVAGVHRREGRREQRHSTPPAK
jgi:hypothetical protein